jgi:hypothetical protein
VDSGTPIHIVFDDLFVSNTKEDHYSTSRLQRQLQPRYTQGRSHLNARVRTYNNEYINLLDVNSALVVPDCVHRLYSVRQATHKGHRTILDSTKPGIWVCKHFVPFLNDPDTNLWLLPLFPPLSKDNRIYQIPNDAAATTTAYPPGRVLYQHQSSTYPTTSRTYADYGSRSTIVSATRLKSHKLYSTSTAR